MVGHSVSVSFACCTVIIGVGGVSKKRKTNNLKDPKTPTRPQEPEERDDPMYIWFCIGPFNVEINLGL